MRDLHQKCYNALFNAGGKVRPARPMRSLRAADPYVLEAWAMAQASIPGRLHTLVLRRRTRLSYSRKEWRSISSHTRGTRIGGIRLENDHIVTADGVDIYTTYPFDERL